MRPVDLSVLISMLDKHEIRFALGGHPEVIALVERQASWCRQNSSAKRADWQ